MSTGNHDALCDTGSTISIISNSLIQPNVKLRRWHQGPVVMLDGTESLPQGTLVLHFKLGSRKFVHNFAVMPCSHPLLLGMDFLHRGGLLFDLLTLQWGFSTSWPNEKFALRTVESSSNVTHNQGIAYSYSGVGKNPTLYSYSER